MPESFLPAESAWHPTPEVVQASNIAWLMQQVGVPTYEELHVWSARDRAAYWRLAIQRLDLRLRSPVVQMLDVSAGPEHARWMVGAEWNIAESCFAAAPESVAIVSQSEGGPLRKMTVGELDALSSRRPPAPPRWSGRSRS